MNDFIEKQYEGVVQAQVESYNTSKQNNQDKFNDAAKKAGNSIEYSGIYGTDSVSAEEMKAFADVYQKTNGAAFSSREELKAALLEYGYKAEASNKLLVDALYNNADKVQELVATQEQFNALEDTQKLGLVTSGVDKEIGQDITATVGNTTMAG